MTAVRAPSCTGWCALGAAWNDRGSGCGSRGGGPGPKKSPTGDVGQENYHERVVRRAGDRRRQRAAAHGAKQGTRPSQGTAAPTQTAAWGGCGGTPGAKRRTPGSSTTRARVGVACYLLYDTWRYRANSTSHPVRICRPYSARLSCASSPRAPRLPVLFRGHGQRAGRRLTRRRRWGLTLSSRCRRAGEPHGQGWARAKKCPARGQAQSPSERTRSRGNPAWNRQRRGGQCAATPAPGPGGPGHRATVEQRCGGGNPRGALPCGVPTLARADAGCIGQFTRHVPRHASGP